MRSPEWTSKLVPTLMVVGVVSLLASLLLGGFIVYQWVLACEAAAASIALFAFGLRYYRRDPRKSKWPPLLPLAVIFASGSAKSFYVVTGRDTPWAVVAILLLAVVWFGVSSWKTLRLQRQAAG